MTEKEIEDWMEHIPVFAVTDSNGAGVVLKPDDDTSVFYFFLNPLAANASLTHLKSINPDMDLKISAFSLGKIWFKLLNAPADTEVLVRSNDAPDGAVEFTHRIFSCFLTSLFHRSESCSSKMLDPTRVKPQRESSTVSLQIREIFWEPVCW